MFLNSSSESQITQGFGFVEGTVAMLNEKMCRVPQQGWSKLIAPDSVTFSEFNEEFFYFSHSYKMILGSTGTAIYNARHDREVITAFFIDKNVLGVQFHPERSGPKGLNFLEKAVLSANLWA